MEKLTLEHLAPYLPYGLKVQTEDGIYDAEGWSNDIGIMLNTIDYGFNAVPAYKLLLRPMSDIIKDINWGIQTYSFIDLFEIGDTGGCIWEFTHGNIKTIQQLQTIAKYNVIHDINYLPFAVVQLMFEYHFDVFGLIEKGLAISIHDVKEIQS